MLKKVQEIRDHISTNGNKEDYREEVLETQDTTEQRRKRKFSEMTPTEKQHQFIDPQFNELETHVVGAPVTNMALRKDGTEQTGSGSNGTREGNYTFLFYKDKYCAEKKKRQDLEREIEDFKKSNKIKDQSGGKLELNRTVQSLANEVKDLQDRDANPKEELQVRNKEFGKLKGVLKKQALSDSGSQRDPENLQGQSKFKKLEEFSDLTAIRKELQKQRQPQPC